MSYIGKGVEVVTFNTATTLDVAGNITVGGTVDGRDVATDGTKLDTIAANAIANLSEDTTPQLGGNLDLNTSNVIGTGNINVTGSITGTSFVSTGDMSFTNNSKAIFGTSPSLEIYHDGSNSILDDVGAGNFKMQLAGADKLEITSTGVDVTGTVTADGLTVDGDLAVSAANSRMRLYETDTTDLNTQLQNQAGDFNIQTLNDSASSSTNRISIDHATGDISFYDNTGTTQGFFWDASTQRLGLGTTTPYVNLESYVSATGAIPTDETVGVSTGNSNIAIGAFNANNSATFSGIALETRTSAASRWLIANEWKSSFLGDLVFRYRNGGASSAEAMRIDSSGNLLHGKTVQAIGTVGVTLVNGQITATADGADAIRLNRKSSDGSIIDLRKNGTTVGDIGVNNSDNLRIQGNSGHSGIEFGTNAIFPHKNGSNVDATIDLGESSLRWKDLFLSGGVRATGSLDLTVPETAGAAVQVEFGNNTNTTRRTVQFYKDNIQPAVADNGLIGLGTSGARFNNLYLSGGVFLGGVGSANYLDDYEEGTWTPQIWKNTTQVTSPTSALGLYRKIGNIIFYSFYFFKSSGSNTDNLGWTLRGMPFSMKAGSSGANVSLTSDYTGINGVNYFNQSGSHRWQANGNAYFDLYGPQSTTQWTTSHIEFSGSGFVYAL